MNKAAKKRLIVVGLVIVVVALALFAVLGGGAAAATLTVEQAVSGDYEGKKIQVSGPVVKDSYTTEGTNCIFKIAGSEEGSTAELEVIYGKGMPSSFGTGVTAICTGTLQDGTLLCSELATKCPSKYESAEGAVTAAVIAAAPASYVGVDVKLAGYVTEGSIADASQDVRFVVNSQGSSLNVSYKDALPEGMEDGSAVVVSGALDADGETFVATDVALDASVQSE